MSEPNKATEPALKRVRIRLYEEHLGYINQGFLEAFQETCQITKLNPWIRHLSYREFGLFLEKREDLDVLQSLLASRHYENIAEWVKECMRKEMYPATERVPSE